MDNVKELLQNVYSISNSWKRFLDKRSESFNIFEALYMETEEADQLTPTGAIEEYAEKRYSGSHSTILLNRIVYRDYKEFLASLYH